jgi:flagellar motor switch protein FliM
VPNTPRASGASIASSSSRASDDVQWYQSSGRPGELAWLADNFARSFSAAAGGLLRADVSTRLAAVAETSRRQFTQAVEEPTCAFSLILAGAQPTDPTTVTCLEFSPAIAMVLVERLMGGTGDGSPLASGNRAGGLAAELNSAPTPPPQRPLTSAERRVLLHLANLVALTLSVAHPGGKSGELRADLAPAGGSGDDRVVVATFELSLSGRVGTMRLCGCGRLAWAARGGADKRTTAAPLEVTAAIEGLELDSADLADLAIGDILATEVPLDGEITIRIGGIPKYAARLRVIDGRKVVTITRRLAPRGQ